jgi:NAD(P)-dependent dehydrogenase (short-subunit alcohol dehydrogenase family)
MPRWTTDDIPDQTGRTAIVTGANSGVGFVTALWLAKRGARVTVAGRNEQSGSRAVDEIRRKAPDGDVTWERLDLADLGSVRSFAEAFNDRNDALDLLINNAGVAFVPYGKTVDGFEITFGTNHLGHFALTGRLLPLLLERPEARVVTVSSDVHEWRRAQLDLNDLHYEQGYKRATAYARSKLANLLFTQELHRRLVASGHTVRSIATNPGPTATNLGPSLPGDRFIRLLLRAVAKSPSVGAAPTLYAATALDANSGDLFQPKRGVPVRHRGAPWAYDKDAARRLWEISESLTGVSFPVGSVKP